MQFGMNVGCCDCGKGVVVEVTPHVAEHIEMIAGIMGATVHNYFGERRCECGRAVAVTATATFMARERREEEP